MLALSPLLLALPARAADATAVWRRAMMGTRVDIVVADRASPALSAAVEAAWAEMARLSAMMSRFDPASRLSALNRAAGARRVAIPPEMAQVLRLAQRLSARTGGGFDVTVGRLTAGPGGLSAGEVPDEQTVADALRHIRPQHLVLDADGRSALIDDPATRIDLGGVAKLPILDAGLQLLSARGIDGAMINGGGDVVASARADGRAWRIGIRDAAHPQRLLSVLPLVAGVVASSGDYERFVMHDGRRYHHIVDPASGRPTRGLSGATLVADQVDQVNGLGTAAMVAGAANAPALLRHLGIERYLLTAEDGHTTTAPALAARLLPPPGRG